MHLPHEGMFKSLAELVRLSRAEESVFLTVAGSYMDESFDPKRSGQARGFFVVAGLMGRGWAIFELERNWEKLLVKHGLEYFKASECEFGRKQFGQFVKDSKNISTDERKVLDTIWLEFIKVIPYPVALDSTHYLTGSGVAILQEDFYEVIKDAHAHAVLGDDPYRLAYDLAFVASAWLMKQLGKNGEYQSFAMSMKDIAPSLLRHTEN